MEEIKLDGKSNDILNKNIETFKELFPEIITEGKIDFEKFKIIFSEEMDDSTERYSFSWPGKTKAIKESQKQSTGTLRPCKEESKDWDTTQNLYIEGENLEVLKLLQKTYFNKVSAIYIDPPYNTGNDIIYKNDYSDSIENYLRITGRISSLNDDEDGIVRLTTNTQSEGRYHSNWLSMMYPLLKLARNLLNNQGIIFVAIDDYEVHNLRKILEEVFGESNFIGTLITKCNPQGRGKKNLDPVHEYHLIFAKNIDFMEELKIKRNSENQGFQNFMRSGTNSRKHERPNRFYPMLVKENKVSVITLEEYERIFDGKNFDEDFLVDLKEKYESLGYTVIFPIARNGEEKVWQRTFERAQSECSTYICENGVIKTPKSDLRTPISLWVDKEYSNVQFGTNELLKLFDNKKTFEYPKSFLTVKELVSMAKEGIVLDFFAGSSTTAHSVMALNNEKNSNYKFILIQIPALIDSDQEAYRLGFENLCEIGKERIRRAGDKIVQESENENIDTGFKVFKLDSSNMIKWDPDYNNLEQTLLIAEDNIKPERTKEDLIYEIMLKYGIDLTLPVEKYENRNTIYSIGAGALIICLDDKITRDITEDILELSKDSEISRVVFKDNGFVSDADKTNIKKILEVNGIEKFITF